MLHDRPLRTAYCKRCDSNNFFSQGASALVQYQLVKSRKSLVPSLTYNSRETFHQFSMLLRCKESQTDLFLRSPSIWEETTLEPSLLTLPKVLLEVKKSRIQATQSWCQLDLKLLEELSTSLENPSMRRDLSTHQSFCQSIEMPHRSRTKVQELNS